ncbi:MAG: hypothetical protein ACPMAQ_10985, partial [Phycisphaerae bacterium]
GPQRALATEHRLQPGTPDGDSRPGRRGLPAAKEAHHYRVIQSLRYTIGADPAQIAEFDQFRKKRNIGGYKRAGTVSDREAEEMIGFAARLREDVGRWLRANHPELW